MSKKVRSNFTKLDLRSPVWEHVFTVAPLVVIGSKEEDGYDLAPKHMATPLGFGNYFGFVCTPKHSTYQNIKKHGFFTVSFPLPNNVLLASLSASPRYDYESKSDTLIKVLPTLKATTMDSLFLADSYLNFECELFKIIDGFDDNSIIAGKIKAAFVDSNYLKVSDKDEQLQLKDNPLLAYIASGRFATIMETYNFPFPKGFKH